MLKIRRIRQNFLQVMMIVMMMLLLLLVMAIVLLLLLLAIVSTYLCWGTGRASGGQIRKQHAEVEVAACAAHRYRDSTRSLHDVLVRFLMRL